MPFSLAGHIVNTLACERPICAVVRSGARGVVSQESIPLLPQLFSPLKWRVQPFCETPISSLPPPPLHFYSNSHGQVLESLVVYSGADS